MRCIGKWRRKQDVGCNEAKGAGIGFVVSEVEKKRRITPPLYLFASLILMWLLNRYWPLYRYLHEPWTYLGIVPVLAGIAVAMVSARRFLHAKTGIVPFDKATTLVTGGFYRHTRNPMYLGLFMILIGVALMMGSLASLLPVWLFMLVIRYNFVAGEERFLEAAFGRDYLEFKHKVRRWF